MIFDKRNKFFLTLTFIILLFLNYKHFKKIPIFFHMHCFGVKTCYGEKVKVESRPISVNENDSLLSNIGSSRATAYQDLNKIFETKNGYVVSWLDNDKDIFRLKLRYFSKDHISNSEYDLGQVVDNHGGGSITVTSGNIIHVAYYPHGDDHVLYREGKIKQNNIIDWEKPVSVGDHLTYPKIFSHNKKIYIAARRTKHSIGKDPRPQLVIYEKINKRDFSKPRILLKSRLDGYANFNFYINRLQNEKYLYLILKRVEGSDNKDYMISQSVEIYKFSNELSIESMFYNIEADNAKAIFQLEGGLKKNNSLEIGPGFNVEDMNVIPLIIEKMNSSELFLIEIKNDEVDLQKMNFLLDKKNKQYFFTKTLGGTVIDKKNNAFLVTNIANLILDRPNKFFNWGHDSSYIYVFIFNPLDSSKKCKLVIENPINNAPEWLPHVRTVQGQSILMYTSGKIGKSNSENVKTKVFIRNLSKYAEKNC
tara:strand:- start:3216 stop:4649 length:1434 start_codon:yes stop_codon:yes gene_type:complete